MGILLGGKAPNVAVLQLLVEPFRLPVGLWIEDRLTLALGWLQNSFHNWEMTWGPGSNTTTSFNVKP